MVYQMEGKLSKLPSELDPLNYHQILVPDSVSLVEQLVADLVHTTESLKRYKKLCQNVLEVGSVLMVLF